MSAKYPTPPATRMRGEYRDIPAGALPDMPCGGIDRHGNPYPGVQVFRPEYITADVRDGRISEVRIWGRRVLKDGSLGVEHLDYLVEF